MGERSVQMLSKKKERAYYLHQLMTDLEALETMLHEGVIEQDCIRIGAEQEFCLIGPDWYPSTNSLNILKDINDPHFTTEITRYNLEINLDPIPLGGSCFGEMHNQLNYLLQKAKKVSENYHTRVLLTGILPTITPKHLRLDYMTPKERYFILNEAIKAMRGTNFTLYIKGADEINLLHDSILFEGCNTSFQCHLQIAPDKFVDSYNWAQAISGPLLALCANSPLLLGKELWSETRIALFTQSVDTRSGSYELQESEPRVSFGKGWAVGSPVDIFKDNVVRFPSLLTTEIEEDSLTQLKRGTIPKLRALTLHNGTVYRWNRPCYGITEGKPHLRIENRYLPSGPTTVDEIANFLFWVGMMKGQNKRYLEVQNRMDFEDVKINFFNAARNGMATQFHWMGSLIPSHKLLLEELLPLAYDGLQTVNITPQDISYYLGVIEQRVRSQTGDRWLVKNYRNLKKKRRPDDALRELTTAIYMNQEHGSPVASWLPVQGDTPMDNNTIKLVLHSMNREVISVYEKDSVELVIKMMEWKKINHIPVVNKTNVLTGLLTFTDLVGLELDRHHESVKSIMMKELITIGPYQKIEEARFLMEKNHIHCLPVVNEGRLVGILTDKDI